MECSQCRRELQKNYCYCSFCVSKNTTHLMNRWNDTSDLDGINNKVKQIEQRLEAVEEYLREIKIQMVEIHQLCSKRHRVKGGNS